MSPAPVVQDQAAPVDPKALPKPDEAPKHQEDDNDDDDDEEAVLGEVGAAGAFYCNETMRMELT